MRAISRAVMLLVAGLAVAQVARAQWTVQHSGLDTNLRGVSVVANGSPDGSVTVWASGSNGVILRSIDAGKHWKRLPAVGGKDADGRLLDFRGIAALSEKIAYVMSSGEGEKSTIYKTMDGGESWVLQYTDKRKEFFLDGLVCLSEQECYVLGDPIDGKFVLLATKDGEHWESLSSRNMPAALAGEGAFAASNSSLSANKDREIFFGTGGLEARVYRSMNGGKTWNVVKSPIASGNASSGIFSITRGSGKTVFVVGGDYKNQEAATGIAAYSPDEGATWHLAEASPTGYRSAVVWLDEGGLVAVGPTGSDISRDSGLHWKTLGSMPLNAMSTLKPDEVWAVGPNGTIAHFGIRRFLSGIR